jgi:hypothetical protein
MTNIQLKEEERIEIVAKRIFAYYLQIIEHYKKKGDASLIIDKITGNDENTSLVQLENKYDGRSRWRDALRMNSEDADWHTLGTTEAEQFRKMGQNDNSLFYIDMEQVLQQVSLLLSKEGVVNYFENPTSDLENYFWKTDKKWLIVVLK